MTNAAGYCAQGLCQASSCGDFWGSLSFCGVLNSNPCRQSCAVLDVNTGKPGACTDGFTTPSMNLMEGTMCKAYPYSTCQLRSGTGGSTGIASVMDCVPSALGDSSDFAWVTGPWSTCLGECGVGTVSRTVECISADTGRAADSDSSCTSSKPASAQACQLAVCPRYAWSDPIWSPCDSDCGTGMQYNHPRCMNNGLVQPVVVPAHFCSDNPALIPPPTIRNCTGPLGPTCPLTWKFTPYSPCTHTCGGGVQLSTRTCVQTRNGLTYQLADSFCTGVLASQPTSRPCNTNICPSSYWQYGVWTACSWSCGGGMQSRTATCIDSITGTVTDEVRTNNHGLD
jgi:hypothetical protein